MDSGSELTPAAIRAAWVENSDKRARDVADMLGISEAELVAASTGTGAVRIAADPDRLIPALADLGEVMALTRNPSCVHEKVGVYANFHPGQHAAMVLTPEIDLRLFPSHWVHGFAVATAADDGTTRRSIQVFDAAGGAVHKVHLRAASDVGAWDRLVAALATGETADHLDVTPPQGPEAPKANPDKADVLRAEWRRMTDTHQFMRLTSKLKMNRLGAYRLAGAPFVRPLAPAAVDAGLAAAARTGCEIMIFCGNRGCIQIHGGPIETLRPMGPWQNVMDPGFNLHLRRDHVAEVWAVEKPTQRGPAVSLEAFDADGGLITQIFGRAGEERDDRAAWAEIVAGLPGLDVPA